MRLDRIWAILFGIGAACAVGLAVEIVCRSYMNKLDPGPTFYYGLMTHQQPPLTYGLVPNNVTKDLAYGTYAVMTTNSYGFRYPADPVIPKPPGLTRIFVLGASAAFGLYVMDHETFSAQLDMYLKKVLGQVEVINAAVPGYRSQDELKMLLFKVLPFDPDLLIIYDGYNDLAANFGPVSDDLTPFGWKTDLEKKMLRRQALAAQSPYRLIYEDFVTYSGVTRMIRHLMKSEARVDVVSDSARPPLPEAISLYGRMIQTMAAAARGQGSDVIVAFQPNIYYGHNGRSAADLAALEKDQKQRPERIPRFQRLTPQYLESARQAARKTGARFLDLTGVFNGADADCFLDYVHLTPYGHLVVARKLFPEIESVLYEKGIVRAADSARVRQLFNECDMRMADLLKGHAGRTLLKVDDPQDSYLTNVRYHLSKVLPDLRDPRIDQTITVLENQPQNWRAHQDLGQILLRKEIFIPAIAHLKEAIKYMPKDADHSPSYVRAHLNVGYALFRTGNNDEAAGHLLEVLKQSPGHMRAHYALGHVHMQKKDMAAARQHFSEALRLDPQFSPARINLEKIDRMSGPPN